MVSLSQDSFYRELSEQEIARAERGMFNFDHPDAFDWDLMVPCHGEPIAGADAKPTLERHLGRS